MRKKLLSVVLTGAVLISAAAPVVSNAAGTSQTEKFSVISAASGLGFEDMSQFGFWTNAAEAPQNSKSYYWKTNDAGFAAYEGSSAVYFDGAGKSVSLWKGVDNSRLATGDTISGTYMFKLLEKGEWWHCPTIRIYYKNDSNETVYLCESVGLNPNAEGSEKYNIYSSPVGQWKKLNIVSTGNTYVAGKALTIEIINGNGTDVPCMIDDIVIGKYQTIADTDPGFVQYTDAHSWLDLNNASSIVQGRNSNNVSIITLPDYEGGDNGVASLANSYALWGGGAVPSAAKTGDLISGYYAFYLNQPKHDAADGSAWFELPKAIFYRAGDPEYVYCEYTFDASMFSWSTAEAYKWYRIKLESTGNPYTEGEMIDFKIEHNGGGMAFLLDDVMIGTAENTAPEQKYFIFDGNTAQDLKAVDTVELTVSENETVKTGTAPVDMVSLFPILENAEGDSVFSFGLYVDDVPAGVSISNMRLYSK